MCGVVQRGTTGLCCTPCSFSKNVGLFITHHKKISVESLINLTACCSYHIKIFHTLNCFFLINIILQYLDLFFKFSTQHSVLISLMYSLFLHNYWYCIKVSHLWECRWSKSQMSEPCSWCLGNHVLSHHTEARIFARYIRSTRQVTRNVPCDPSSRLNTMPIVL